LNNNNTLFQFKPLHNSNHHNSEVNKAKSLVINLSLSYSIKVENNIVPLETRSKPLLQTITQGNILSCSKIYKKLIVR